MNKSITICFICQGNGKKNSKSKYEYMANILAITTRYYNPNIKILVGIPTPFNIYPEPGKDTYELLDKLNIEYIYTENYVSHDYKIANKLGLLDKVNNETDTDYVLFLDTDIICVGELIPNEKMYNSDISGVFTDYGDRPNSDRGEYWKKLHDKLNINYDIPTDPIGFSLFSHSPMWAPYLCAGYIFMKRNPIVTKTLNEICGNLYNDIGGHFKKSNNWGGHAAPDQQAIALTINKLKLSYCILDYEHIYSLIPGHYLPTTNTKFINEYDEYIVNKPTHMTPQYRDRINTDEKICCKYCYDTYLTDQQFIHYHKPTRISEFFFGFGITKLLLNIKENDWNNNENIHLFIDNNNSKLVKKKNNELVYPIEIYKNILTVISNTTRNDWIQKIHNVDKKIKKQRCNICNMYPSNHKSRNCPDKKPNSP